MIETLIGAAIAAITGAAALTTRLHKRIDEARLGINEANQRINLVELNMARHYVFKDDFDKAFGKMERHMMRIEEKLDGLLMYRRAGDPHDN